MDYVPYVGGEAARYCGAFPQVRYPRPALPNLSPLSGYTLMPTGTLGSFFNPTRKWFRFPREVLELKPIGAV